LFHSHTADDVLQETIWHFTQADLSNSSVNTGSANPSGDAQKVGRSLLKAFQIIWGQAAYEGKDLLADFASFGRLTLADAAELVETSAATAKKALRETEDEVQAGERTAAGTKRPAESEPEDADARVKFEKTMDSLKVAGSKVIGAGQKTTDKVQKTTKSGSDRLYDAYYKVCAYLSHSLHLI
jgi:hypothetical protein